MECTGCGHVFGSLSAFDAHQDWDDPASRERQTVCADPADAGLVMGTRGLWIEGKEVTFTRP